MQRVASVEQTTKFPPLSNLNIGGCRAGKPVGNCTNDLIYAEFRKRIIF